MKTWVITGGPATGKSRFCQLLSEMGAGVFTIASSDEIVHELLRQPDVGSSIIEAFGEGVRANGGGVDREALRSVVFADADARTRLEKLLHPLVFERLNLARQGALEGTRQLFVAEVPLFYEAGAAFPADLVIVVAAGSACQLQRMTGDRGLDPDTAGRILAAQLPLETKIGQAQAVVWNEGSPELLKAQAQVLLDQLP